MLGVSQKNGCVRVRIQRKHKYMEFYGFYSEEQAGYIWDAMKRICHPETTRYNFPSSEPQWAIDKAKELLNEHH